jgi:S1-C subfamily serine protease
MIILQKIALKLKNLILKINMLNSVKVLLLLLIFSLGTITIPHVHSLWLINKANNVVFKMTSLHNIDGGSGTGFIVKDPKGRKFLVTNYHVCQGLNNGTPFLLATATVRPHTSHRVRILAASIEDDVCITTPVEREETPLILSDYFYIGQNVHLMGHPLGDIFRKSSGEIVGVKDITVMQYFLGIPIPVSYSAVQISNFARGGNSGSPVLNDWGNVVGILFAGDQRSEHIAFFIPACNILKVLESVK